ncbi:MAG TPA: VWA domain-containing protein, partial [Kofleriaceae bacterium]
YLSSGTCPSFHASSCTINNMAGVKNAIDMGNINGTDPLPEALLALHDSFGNVTGDPKVIVLATDGTPNSCGNPNVDHSQQAVDQALANFNDKHISLYVIGLGGVDTNFLQKIANAGLGSTTNVPYYSTNSAANVLAGYTSVFNAVLDCEMTIDGTIDVAQASLGTVKSNGMALAYTTDWVAVDDHTIKLVGMACSNYNAAPTAPEITATFTCGSSH